MTSTNPAPTSGGLRALRAILCAGLVGGVLDISYILIVYAFAGISSLRILQGVAYSVLGSAAYREGWGSGGLGLAVHFGVAFGAATLFYLLSRQFKFLVRRPIRGGMLFGIFFYLLMNLVVLKFTLLPPKPFPPSGWSIDLLSHLFLVGVPMALIVRRLAP